RRLTTLDLRGRPWHDGEKGLQNVTPYGVVYYGSLERRPNRNFAPHAASNHWAAREWAGPLPRRREAVRHRFECGDKTPEAARKSWTDRTQETGSRSLHFISGRTPSRGGGMGERI